MARLSGAAALALAALAILPAVAPAASVSQNFANHVFITGAPNEVSDLAVDVSDLGGGLGTHVAVQELGSATVTAVGDDCTQVDPKRVTCNATGGGHTGMTIALGDMGDELSVDRSVPLDVWVTGGTGNDGIQALGDGAADVDGGDGNDEIGTSVGDDFIDGGDGDDLVDGWLGADVLTGGDGFDTVSYDGRPSAVTVTVGTGVNDGEPGERDFVAGDLEKVVGGDGSDTLVGNGAANVLVGLSGGDVMRGGGGADVLDGSDSGSNDVLDGGAGVDTADYTFRGDRLWISVGDGPNDGGDVGLGPGSEADDVQAVERILGGSGNDQISGSDVADTLAGNGGNDLLDGGDGADTLDGGLGADRLFGGDAVDTVTYAGRTAPVHVTIGTGVNDGATGEGDYVASDAENVTGGNGADTLTGSAAANRLDGAAGNDTLNGRGGPDAMVGGTGGGDMVTYVGQSANVVADLDGLADDGADPDANGTANEGDAIHPTVEGLTGGAGDDRFTGNAAANTFRGGAGDDIMNAGDGADTLDGGLDADLMVGEGGNDTATYAGRADALTVVIDGLGNDGGAGDDSARDYVGTENVIGGNAGDSLTGDGLANILTGGPGSDTLRGLGGADLLRARDRVADALVECGAGVDRAEADAADNVTTLGPEACETVA